MPAVTPSTSDRRTLRRDPSKAQAPVASDDDLVLLYTPEPLPDLPLCIPLPAGWFDDPGYQLLPYAFAGCTSQPTQFGVFGTSVRKNEQLAMDYGECFAHGYFGPPKSGKSYIEGVHLESALMRNPYQSRLVNPLCGVSLSYGQHAGGGHAAEQLSSRLPNQVPDEVRELIHEHGTLPQGMDDVVALTLKKRVLDLRRAHPYSMVLGLGFSCRELGITGIKALMVMDEKEDSLLAEEISDLLNTLPRGFVKQDLLDAVESYSFRNEYLRSTVRKRVALCCGYIDDRMSIRDLVKPGRLIVVDIRDGWLAPRKAMKLFGIVLNILVLGEGELPCNLLLCIDEAHKFLEYRDMRLQIEHIIRERRHLRVSVILSSQNPGKVPHSTLAELDGVGLFHTESERVLLRLARDIEPFAHATPADLMALRNGQMLFWSRRWYCPYAPGEFDGILVRVQVRPRLSHHGGATRRGDR